MRITNRRGFMKDPRLRSTYQRLLSGRQGGRRPVAGQDPNRAMQAVNAMQGTQTQRASSGYRSDGPGQRMQNFHRNRSNEQGGIGRPAHAGYRGFRNPESTAARFRNYGQFRSGLNNKLSTIVADPPPNMPFVSGGGLNGGTRRNPPGWAGTPIPDHGFIRKESPPMPSPVGRPVTPPPAIVPKPPNLYPAPTPRPIVPKPPNLYPAPTPRPIVSGPPNLYPAPTPRPIGMPEFSPGPVASNPAKRDKRAVYIPKQPPRQAWM